MKSGNINTRNTEIDIIVDLNKFFLPRFPDPTFLNPRLLKIAQDCSRLLIGANQLIRRR